MLLAKLGGLEASPSEAPADVWDELDEESSQVRSIMTSVWRVGCVGIISILAATGTSCPSLDGL
jgi:hypothetical protein